MVGELIAGRYELEELVGRGGMSSVYRARDRLLERTVAIKVLHEHYSRDEDYVERFRREARSAAQLSHPNIVTVIDRGEADGRQFIVFEYVDGQNLKELVERQGRLPVRRALEIGVQIGRALGFAHANGLVHRDVKPQNVLLGDGDLKVTDFGIARSLEAQSGLTQTGTVLGTSDYIPPEQASGRPVDALGDMYSLGAVVYELLAGSPPYTGESFLAVAMKHLNEPVPSVLDVRPDVPLRVDAALRRAMAKDPADRFASMDAYVSELEACLVGLGRPDAERTAILPAAAPRRQQGPPLRRRRRRILPLVTLVLGLAAIGAGTASYVAFRDSGGSGGGGSGGAPVTLVASTAYDPEGDGHENNATVRNATDGDPATYWSTEGYATPSFGGLKSGVGLVLDAGKPVEPRSVTIVTDTPGMTAEIEAGSSETDFPDVVAGPRTVDSQTTFDLSMTGPRRYFLVWITHLSGRHGHLNEVTAG